MERNFRQLLEAQWAKGNFVCVGLDSEYRKIPECCRQSYGISEVILAFNEGIVNETHDLVCAYKPNAAFYEAHGDVGWQALRDTVAYIHKVAPEVPVILDAKRGDIGNTNEGYAENVFGYLDVDAVTVSPYLGAESLKPFLGWKDKGIIVLCRTSNPGAYEFQDLRVVTSKSWTTGREFTTPFYKVVAHRVATEWNKNGNCALVVGATVPDELRQVRKLIGDMPILIPGIGTQGGNIEAAVKAGKDSRGAGMIINSSSGIIFADTGYDFAKAARRETEKLREAINQFR